MRLALEALSTSFVPWAVYCIRRRTGFVVVSAYGIQGDPPQINADEVQKALDPGIMEYMGTRSEIFEPCSNHIIIHPELIELPARVHEEIKRIASLSIYASMSASLDVPETFDEGRFLEYLKGGIARNFLFASLFVMDLSSIGASTKKLCAHTTEASLMEELASFTSAITGSIRNVFVLPGFRLLCAVMTHAPGDPELIASLVSKTLLRLISRTHVETIPLGSFASVKLSNEGLESTLRSLFNDL